MNNIERASVLVVILDLNDGMLPLNVNKDYSFSIDFKLILISVFERRHFFLGNYGIRYPLYPLVIL